MAGVLTLIGGSLATSAGAAPAPAAPYTVEILMVGGGGAGGVVTTAVPDQNGGAGGGGAGVLEFATSDLIAQTTYTITIGAGGSNNSGSGRTNNRGANTTFSNPVRYSQGTSAVNPAPTTYLINGPYTAASPGNGVALGGGGGAHTKPAGAGPTPAQIGLDGEYFPGLDSVVVGCGGGASGGSRRIGPPTAFSISGGNAGRSFCFGGSSTNSNISGWGGDGGLSRRGPAPPTIGITGAGGGGGGTRRVIPSPPYSPSPGKGYGGGANGNVPSTAVSPYVTTGSFGGNGGAGELFPYTGIVYGGGGGGGGGQTNQADTGGLGGNGGGGKGASGSATFGSVVGTVNTGGGGGGGAQGAPGSAGGSGIFILVVPTPNYLGASYTGANVAITTPPAAPGKTLLTFNSSGTYTA